MVEVDGDLVELEGAPVDDRGGAPEQAQTVGVGLDHDGLELGREGELVTAEVGAHGPRHDRQGEAQRLGGEVQQLDGLAAVQVGRGGLVGRGGVKEAGVEVGGQVGGALASPRFIVGAGELASRRPRRRDGGEAGREGGVAVVEEGGAAGPRGWGARRR
jgi:hypothetical protein